MLNSYFRKWSKQARWMLNLALTILLMNVPALTHAQTWAQCKCPGRPLTTVQLGPNQTCQSWCGYSSAPRPAPSYPVNTPSQPVSTVNDNQQRENRQQEVEQEEQRQFELRQQQLEQEKQDRIEAQKARDQAAFERRKQLADQQLRMPSGSEDTIHDLKPAQFGQEGSVRDTEIRNIKPRPVSGVVRNVPSKEAAAAAAAGQAGKKQDIDSAVASGREGLDTAGRRAPAKEVDFLHYGTPLKLPPGIEKTDRYKNLNREANQLQRQHQTLEQELAAARAEKQNHPEKKTELEVKEFTIKDQMSHVEYQQKDNGKKLESFIFEFNEENPQQSNNTGQATGTAQKTDKGQTSGNTTSGKK